MDLRIGEAEFASRSDFDSYVTPALFFARRAAERDYASGFASAGDIAGYCGACRAAARFRFDLSTADLDGIPNWRESLHCSSCGLFSRIRHAVSLADAHTPIESARIYATEQATTFYAWLRKRGINVHGSEFVRDASRLEALGRYVSELVGERVRINTEDVTSLTLPDASRDVVFTFDVLEHVPDYRAAVGEFHRVLAPGGLLVVTVPFDTARDQTLVRASIASDGHVEHHVTPEYHGDPAADAGCLAFYTFGWSLLDELRDAGFSSVRLATAWSPALGLLGGQIAVVGVKP